MGLSVAKVGVSGGTAGRRRLILRNQGDSVYDIYKVRYNFLSTSLFDTNEVAAMAVSTRLVDQVEDAVAVGFDTMAIDTGIHFPYSVCFDVATSGANIIQAVHSDDFPSDRPFTVPFLAFLMNVAVSNPVNLGVEVWFERVRVSSLDKASMIRIQSGGRTRPSS